MIDDLFLVLTCTITIKGNQFFPWCSYGLTNYGKCPLIETNHDGSTWVGLYISPHLMNIRSYWNQLMWVALSTSLHSMIYHSHYSWQKEGCITLHPLLWSLIIMQCIIKIFTVIDLSYNKTSILYPILVRVYLREVGIKLGIMSYHISNPWCGVGDILYEHVFGLDLYIIIHPSYKVIVISSSHSYYSTKTTIITCTTYSINHMIITYLPYITWYNGVR